MNQGPLQHFESGWAIEKKKIGRSVCAELRNSQFMQPLYIIYDKKVLFSGSLCM